MERACFVCSRRASTVEHVFPKWLQRRFNLWDQRLQLANGTTIQYRRLVIPACERCNGEVLSGLERLISTDSSTPSDVWRWANKIHFGLAEKDRILAWDRAHPTYTIGDVIRPDDPLELSRHFLHCVSGDFRADPDPYGSVFSFHFGEPQDYWFAHLIASNSICVSLGRTAHLVFVLDGQVNARDPNTSADYRRLRVGCSLADVKFFYARCVERMARHDLGFDVFMKPGTPGFIARVGKLVTHDVRPVNKPLFRMICLEFGLHWIDEDPDWSAGSLSRS